MFSWSDGNTHALPWNIFDNFFQWLGQTCAYDWRRMSDLG